MQRSTLFLRIGIVAGLFIALWFGLWAWLLFTQDPLRHPLARTPLFPIACTTRGCITSTSWLQQHQLTTQFNAATLLDTPAPEETLTTVIRDHLLRHATVRPAVTIEGAARYREEILHITSVDDLPDTISLSLEEYDEMIVLPFLQQEGLRQLHLVESTEELYEILTKQRPVLLLLFNYHWNSARGAATTR